MRNIKAGLTRHQGRLKGGDLCRYGGRGLSMKARNVQERGKEARRADNTAAKAVADAVCSSLGPRGVDKMDVAAGDGATPVTAICAAKVPEPAGQRHPPNSVRRSVNRSLSSKVMSQYLPLLCGLCPSESGPYPPRAHNWLRLEEEKNHFLRRSSRRAGPVNYEYDVVPTQRTSCLAQVSGAAR
ncbi:hypothetical protein WJX73_003772 [Symbiochloris irregularis]|uniref:Uncharacterized protein n=1 Tax=Symbiochloris irregularis TaxID=706552 RepID=A0AAW1PFA9_9CHLO